MKARKQKSKARRQNPRGAHGLAVAAVLLLPWWSVARGDDFAARCADRAAIERVFHEHRTGTKKPFEETMPPSQIEQLVKLDEHKEAVLRKACGVKITPAMVEAEVNRINATTRAPEMLAEIKAALGNDPARFACAMARPIVVEYTLRTRFENDDALHAPQRRKAEQAREKLRASKPVDGTAEVTWQFGPHPAERAVSQAPQKGTPTKATAGSSSYSVEATAQLAQTIALRGSPKDQAHYFDDLNPKLRKVLAAQLRKPSDVSAVIETSDAFLVFVAKEKTAAALTASSLTIPKRSYDQWLAEQPEQ
jgi:hypothetical protein